MPSEQKVVLVMTRHLSYNIHGTFNYREKNKENKGMLPVNLTEVDEQKPQAWFTSLAYLMINLFLKIPRRYTRGT